MKAAATLILATLTLTLLPSIATTAFAQNGIFDQDSIILAGRINSMLTPVQSETMTMPAPMMADNQSSAEAAAMQFSMAQDVSWLLRGDWVMTVSEDNRTTFDAEFIKVTTNGTMLHTHRIANFTSDDNATFSMFDGADATINGTADVYFDDEPVWRQADVALTIINGTVLSVDIESQDIDSHFHGQPIYGTVDTVSKDGVTITLPAPASVQDRIGQELAELQANATQAQQEIGNQTGQAAETFTEEVDDVFGNITSSVREFFGG